MPDWIRHPWAPPLMWRKPTVTYPRLTEFRLSSRLNKWINHLFNLHDARRRP